MDHNNKFFIRLIFFISFVLVFCVSAQKAIAFQAYAHNALTEKVDEMFKQWDKNDSPGAALGIFKDGRIIYARGYGIANLDVFPSLVSTESVTHRIYFKAVYCHVHSHSCRTGKDIPG